MTRVYMIRHGKPAATWGDGSGNDDPGLSDEGRAQARAAADALLALPDQERPTMVFTSPLNRCRETAAPFAEALGTEAVMEPLVAEIPTPKALSTAERGPWLRNAFTQTWNEVDGDLDYREWRDRVAAAVVARAGGAIFTHFVAINAAASAATGDDRVLSFRPDHASITVFDVVDGKLTLVQLGPEAATGVL